MLERSAQALRQLTLPATVLALTFLGAPYFNLLPASVSGVFETGPYWAALLTLTLAVAFNRSRVALFTLALLGGFFVHQRLGTDAPLWHFVVYGLIPVNLAIISCYRERGLLTQPGYLRLALIGLQVGILTWFLNHDTDLLDAWLRLDDGIRGAAEQRLAGQFANLSPIDSPSAATTLLDWRRGISAALAPLTPIEALLLLLAAVTITVASWHFNTAVGFAMFGAGAGYYLMILSGPETLVADAYMLACLALLGIGLLRDSYNMAYRDELTGLPQRRALNEQLLAVGNRYSLAMLDIDHFKKFNDVHGHDVGDQVLQMVASHIKKVAGGGKAFRYGGEEFAVIFNGKDKEDAAYFLEKVRKAIAAYELVIRADERLDETTKKKIQAKRQRGTQPKVVKKASKKVSVTISIGVAERDQPGQTPEEVLILADKALYDAKNAGRNRIASA